MKSALMNNLTKNDLVDQLHLAMRLNQVDLALERINQAQKELLKTSQTAINMCRGGSAEGAIWHWGVNSIIFGATSSSKNIATGDAHELMTEALLHDRVEFVKLLLDHSYVNLARYMSPKVLRALYYRGLEQEDQQPGDNSFFQQLVQNKLKLNQKILDAIQEKVITSGLEPSM